MTGDNQSVIRGRNSTVVTDERGEEICILLRAADGHPAAHGFDLKRFLSCFVVTRGVVTHSLLERNRKFAAGMNCLAAQIVAHFKTATGGFYLYPAGARELGEEFRYTISYSADGVKLKAEAVFQEEWHLLFDGLVEWFDADHAEQTWIERQERLAEKLRRACFNSLEVDDSADEAENMDEIAEETDDWWEAAMHNR
jgi:hypothetical protein